MWSRGRVRVKRAYKYRFYPTVQQHIEPLRTFGCVREVHNLALDARITDRRRDHLHKVTARLVGENQTVVIEDLQVRNMVKNGALARAISDASWSEFHTMLERKAAWYGREVIAIDRWLPSSKTCSACGRLAASMPLHIRTWTCPGCDTTHDRDVNAARNILAAGLAVSARGAGVRPQRETSRRRQSAETQESSGTGRKGIPDLQTGSRQVRGAVTARGVNELGTRTAHLGKPRCAGPSRR